MRHIIVLSLLVLCLAPAPLRAQAGAGVDILTGRVTDLTGKPIADAQVGVTSLRSGLTRSITTDANGHYKIFFPGTPTHYKLEVKRMGFAPAHRTVARRTKGPEEMTIDLQLGGAPLALSMVEINGSPDAPIVRRSEKHSSSEATVAEATVPNPVAEILALKDTLHLSAVQIVALTDVADSLQAKNAAIYKMIRVLLSKSREAGDASLLAGTVAMMLEEASNNTRNAVTDAQKLLQPEQLLILPPVYRQTPER
jgi:hypothetical protein